ncbi:LuxR C-terminal-related transcriptional regulator [Mycolicibacterium novocastrense]|nr:LuxR C-terminal-related transcriptional regulator [Mycolicibacterium novocastrense]
MSTAELSEVEMAELLPTGTVTLLLGDVEGSTQLWETQSAAMTDAIARLNATVDALIPHYAGVRPVEQGEGDSFVAAFACAGDALACALALQRTDLGPIRIRIGLHTGEVQMRDEGNYAGRTINKAARLRDLAHGGQTVMSSVTEELVEDRLPEGAWLTDLGEHALRDFAKQVRIAQLCHGDLRNDFPPLRTMSNVATQHLPAQLTTFVGRGAQMDEIAELLDDNRLVTLTGAGGAGKTRLAIEVAARLAARYPDGAWYADLAPVTHAEVVPVSVARAFGLPDQPGRSISDTLQGYLRNRHLLLVLDNCEHLLQACAELVGDILAACATVTILATSREPLLVPSEVNWSVPSLAIADEAIELFADRARRARPTFTLGDEGDETVATVAEICRRLDGMPLAIELAAARVRALSLTEIADSLHDRFRILTGGARTAVRRQQTLRASVDWSHALLTDPERVLFRRLAVFMGGFDLSAAQAVAASTEVERFQVLDQLSLLVDKSLVVAESDCGPTRYRLLETVRQYALEKLGESGEADDVRNRHCAHYTAMARRLDTPARDDYERLVEQVGLEIDNMRSAFTWSYESDDPAGCLELASSLQPLWLTRGRLVEGQAWLDSALTAHGQSRRACHPAVRARALADKAVLSSWLDISTSLDHALEALQIAREVDDPALTTRALTACACITAHDPARSQPYFAEATKLARALGDSWRLSQILSRQAYGAFMAGDVHAIEPVGLEGREVAETIGDRFNARQCRWVLVNTQAIGGDLVGALEQNAEFIAEATAANDPVNSVIGLMNGTTLRAWHGDFGGAFAAGRRALHVSEEMAGVFDQGIHVTIGLAHLAAGDTVAAWEAAQKSLTLPMNPPAEMTNRALLGQIGLACGEFATALRWLDEAVSTVQGWWLSAASTTRAQLHLATGNLEQSESDAYEALHTAAKAGARITVPDTLDCIAELSCRGDRHRDAVRLLAAADAARRAMGVTRFPAFDSPHHSLVSRLQNALGDSDFHAAWTEGEAMTIDGAVAYALRGRGDRKRPSCGWAALTPTELQVAGLVQEGLSNKDIASRLFVSPRTVQSHLRHIYDKLDVRSRVQLAQEAGRH